MPRDRLSTVDGVLASDSNPRMELNLFSQEPSELSENRKIVETKLRRPKS